MYALESPPHHPLTPVRGKLSSTKLVLDHCSRNCSNLIRAEGFDCCLSPLFPSLLWGFVPSTSHGILPWKWPEGDPWSFPFLPLHLDRYNLPSRSQTSNEDSKTAQGWGIFIPWCHSLCYHLKIWNERHILLKMRIENLNTNIHVRSQHYNVCLRITRETWTTLSSQKAKEWGKEDWCVLEGHRNQLERSPRVQTRNNWETQ